MTVGIAALALAILIALLLGALRQDVPPGNPPSTPETRAASTMRPSVHITPASQWMNDPQRPFWLNGRWHAYYLYNDEYPDGNGTEWFHVTSTDLVHWQDEGVAIEKYTNGLGDVQTGSAVLDTENTSGYGADAVLAIATQQDAGVQRQSLFISKDGGETFEPIEDNPVLDNPGTADFRDPKIVWDEERRVWVMVLAEGEKIGFYTSSDLKDWTYRSGFERPDLGTLECPDLFRMSVEGDPDDTRWVLMSGANGEEYGMTTGTVYWIGTWDGTTFTPVEQQPSWLDRGADFYAAVTWADTRQSRDAQLATRYVMGWMNNWAYARDLPISEWHGGQQSIVRELTLSVGDDAPRLRSRPVLSLDRLTNDVTRMSSVDVPADSIKRLPTASSDAYRIRAVVDAGDPRDGELRLRLKQGGGRFVTVGIDLEAGTAFIARDNDAAAPAMPEPYDDVRTAPIPDGPVKLDIIVDTISVEVFVNDGSISLSSLAFGAPGAQDISAEAVGGDLRIEEFELLNLDSSLTRHTSKR